jgi:hypothetical protein
MKSKIILGIMPALVLATRGTTLTLQESTEATVKGRMIESMASAAAPAVVSGDNVSLGMRTNKTANNNEGVMFRASTDSGQTFGPMLMLATNITIGDGREGGEE